MVKLENILREIISLSPDESFIIFDRIKTSYEYPYHYHPEVEINFIYKGKGYRRLVGDHKGEIDNLELVLVGSNLPHCWANSKKKNKRAHEVTIQFDKSFFDQSILKKNILKPINQLMQDSIKGVLFSQETSEKLKEPILRLSKLNSFDTFIEIMKILYELAISKDKLLLSSYSIVDEEFVESDKMKIIYDFIHKNFNRKILLSEASALVNMSNITFNRFIKKRTGKTLIDYLNDIRINYATRWLIEKNKNISEIAFDSGFNNIANFNKVFKAKKGISPSKFRNQFVGLKKIE